MPLSSFHPVVREWFTEKFGAPSPPQAKGWPVIAGGENTLILAPTGSGKTLAAFLKCLDTLYQEGVTENAGVQVLYISPLKALNNDINRNLQEPLAEIAARAESMGLPLPRLTTGVRTGDTPQRERATMVRRPPHILITTPESLYLLLTSRARDMLASVRYVIVDEIHAICGTKRGVHLSLSLERLEALTSRPPVRIGLSATQRPLEEIARYLGGVGRPVQIVDAGMRKALDLKIEIPLDDMRALPEGTMWAAIRPRLLELISQHKSTLVFVNYRGLAERLAGKLNELAGREVAKVHHGSMSREAREQVEAELKVGLLPCLVATSSLELGIDIGAIDLVVQIESPKSVAAGLQRVGRAGHVLGATAKGRLIPKYRGDLLEMACLVREMARGQVEQTRIPTGPLDILAQQITAMAAMDDWRVEDLLALCRRSYCYRDLSERQLSTVLEMLSGRYPAEEFRDLRPRIIWDFEAGTIRARDGAKALAILSGGTIPDRGYYGVYIEGAEKKLGEMDEEFVYESSVGDVFLLGSSTWRIMRIEHDRITVAPAVGQVPRLPFWKGEGVGRPFELGQKVGAFVRELALGMADDTLPARLQEECRLDGRAVKNLLTYLADQQNATDLIPSDRQIVVESFWDEGGDRRVVIHSPYGGRVHLAWMVILKKRIRQLMNLEVEMLQTDDGILMRFPGAEAAPPLEQILRIDPADAEALLLEEVGNTAVFAAYFRMNAGRAMVLPRPRPGRRLPFWIQRMRAADLLQVARKYDAFPVVLETYREVMREVFNVTGLTHVLTGLSRGEIGLHLADTVAPSPMATTVMMGFTAAHLYDDETPKAELKGALLSLNRDLLREILGSEGLRELLDPEAIQEVHDRLQRLTPEWQPRTPDEVEDLLRQVGDLTAAELAARGVMPHWLEALAAERRVVKLGIAGEERWVAAQDAGAYADPVEYAAPILRRYARTRTPFLATAPAQRYALPLDTVLHHLQSLREEGVLGAGEYTQGVSGLEYADLGVLQQSHRRTLARLRSEIQPVDGETYARFLLNWHGLTAPVAPPARGGAVPAALKRAFSLLQGAPLPAESWERDLLPARVPSYQPMWLDQLCATGELAWAAAPGGRLAFYLTERMAPFAGRLGGPRPESLTPEQEKVLAALGRSGADFLGGIARWSGLTPPEALAALLELAKLGLVTNDTFAPVRQAFKGGKGGARRGRPTPLQGATGRWSLTERLLPPDTQGDAESYARILLERYGVVTREAASAEDGPYTWSEVLDALKRMELRGQVRRGYFIHGLSGYQFALPDAVERLRACREQEGEEAVLVHTCDPACAFGAILHMPERARLSRVAGNSLVLLGGRPALAIESGGKRLTPLLPLAGDTLTAVLGACKGLVRGQRRIDVERWDGEPVLASPVAAQLQRLGFERTPKALVLYRQR